MNTLVELCAGTASVSLCALAGRPIQPLVGYMGSKRRWAELIARRLGYGPWTRPDRVVLVDAGPWGEVWSTLRTSWREVARHLEVLDARGPLHTWWGDLSREPLREDLAERSAVYLCLQARSASSIPIWHDGVSWTSPTGSRTEVAHQRRGRSGDKLPAKALMAAGGLVRVATIARRLAEVGPLLDRVEVVHGDLRGLEPIPGAAVYFDPPYLHCPRYAALCPREDVLRVASRWASAGCRVLVSEAEALGPVSEPLRHPRGKGEVLTTWRAA